VASPDVAGLARLVRQRWPGQVQADPVQADPAQAGTAQAGTVVLRDVDAASVGAAAFAAGVELHELTRRDVGLEDLFLQLTGDGAPDAARPA
jgi:ABC-2 type transport system ATP-binding protein